MGVDYSKYIEMCREVVQDKGTFSNFRRHERYRVIMDNVSVTQGLACLRIVKKENPELLGNLAKFAKSEKVGNPKQVVLYEEFKVPLCPTTCRYIKILSDLMNLFGSLDNLNIVEIGVGYGGQCKIIYDVFKPKSYTLIDLPEALEVSKTYLSYFNIKPILRDMNDISHIEYDLCLSNYAFSEFDRPYQDFYAEHIIKYSKNGYMICNFVDQRGEPDAMKLWELSALRSEGKMQPEIPNTGANMLYTWSSNHK